MKVHIRFDRYQLSKTIRYQTKTYRFFPTRKNIIKLYAVWNNFKKYTNLNQDNLKRE